MPSQHLEQQRRLDPAQAELAAQVFAEAATLPWAQQLVPHLRFALPGQQVQMQYRPAIARQRVAQVGGHRIHQAAFDAVGADHALALLRTGLAVQRGPVRHHRLQRRAGLAVAEVGRPVDIETAVGRFQRRDVDAARGQWGHPGAVRTQLRPAATAGGQHHRIGVCPRHAVGGVEPQCAVVVPAGPAVLDMEAHPGLLQAAHPAAQQRRGLAVEREYPARTAHVRLHTEAPRPLAQSRAVEVGQPRTHLCCAFAIARHEQVVRVGVGQVQAALAGDQELAPGRTLGLVQVHGVAGGAHGLGGHQAGRAAADDGYAAYCGCCVVHAGQRGLTSSSSTSNTSEAFGGIGPAPEAP